MDENLIKFGFGLLLLLVTTVFGLLIAFPVMWCWNYSMVSTFSLPTITWGQSWCLFMLCNWLLKSHLYYPRKS